MKKLICIVSIVIVIVACKKESTKDYVTLSGTIKNQSSDSLLIGKRSVIKKMKVDAEGNFSDTLKVEETGNYILFDGEQRASIYLKNGYDLNINLDTKKFHETLVFSGNGAEANNYLVKKGILEKRLFDYETLLAMDQASLDRTMDEYTKSVTSLLETTKSLDSSFVASEKKNTKMTTEMLKRTYQKKQLLALKGQASPKFVDYENYAGGTTSLNDLKGKYVYIDMWATWCGPCKAEIPFLKEVEKAYHDKNIAFVSISIDKKKAYNTWRNMVKDKALSGIQLWAKEDKTFVDEYKVSGIPRFILIDPNGNVVNADAPRPSSDKLKVLFKELNI
ncbi:TlpA disulfide reductase family protein [Flavivirga amylovorans]|uniref:TlpA disulfide reductase family protein n=1 Tax=Flavivirga amylovorans TaxID=870486 RepID=A0ABT8X0Z0_9FLAO|nr:TlpA disulfide reductase family protein [Flavivirga amylovorans]MDO5987617.1 TlpA disulfide reductase family protein [Flavivirga amylovorans]